MKCECGNNRFYGEQEVKMKVIVDEDGNFFNGVSKDISRDVLEYETPYGPFICTKCRKRWYEISFPELKK